jgi:hypothetical protein
MLSALKSTVLVGADAFNALVGGPSPFTRQVNPDPSGHFVDDMTRRNYIAAQAEAELAAFVRDGVFLAELPNSLGDAAIWQGVYLAMTAMRFSVSGTIPARVALHQAAAAMAAYLRRGVLYRGAVPKDLPGVSMDPSKAYFTEDGLLLRDDASLDSMLGIMFGAAFVQRFGDAEARGLLAAPLEEFSDRFAADGFRLVRRDGTPTTYGDCRPGFFQAPVRTLAAALPCLLAEGPMGACWRGIAKAYGAEFATTDTQVPGRISYVNAHLAALANMAYVCAAPSGAPGLEEAREGLRRLVAKYADAGNSFIVYGAAALGLPLTTSARDKAAKVLSEFPLGSKPKAGLNSSEAPALQPVPVWQRPPSDYIFQRSPYPYRGSETLAYSRLDYLLAHYLSRSPR